MLVAVNQINESEDRYNSWQGKSGREESVRLTDEELIANIDDKISDTVAKGNILPSKKNLVKRKEMLQAVGKEPVEFAYERAIGNNDSVYSNFCELIAFAKRKVGRIVVKEGNSTTGYATGFMVSERLLLTNWHVFETESKVAQSEVEFFYELDIFGRSNQPVVFKLNSAAFFYSFKELDYCLVAVNSNDITGKVSLSSIGYIYLDPTLGKLGDERQELLNIIHHPNGDHKQLSIRENLFTKIMPTTIWYESDTAQGSSGSPVFNDQWQVVALHHLGIPAKSPDGQFYLDKNDNRIEPVNGKIDISKIYWIANEGIRVSVILKDIFEKYPDSPIVNGLKKAFIPSSITFLNINADNINPTPASLEQTTNDMDTNNSNNVQISFPASLIEKNGNITININNGPSDGQLALTAPLQKAASGGIEVDFTEAKKIEREDAMDFSACKGYQSLFLGSDTDIPIPQPKQSIRHFVAKLKNSDGIILKYYHYSTIFHSVRMMPIISAINVDGEPEGRKDTTARVDDWLRDNRLDYDIQLNDNYYKGSGFERGHMSRREDANWGPTPELAKLYADVTCVYTNACPQVATLNRSSRGGLWGKLETVILEKGALKERGKTARISVFNGPIFAESDSVFRGIQVPMEFFKIILWFNDSNELKATAFKLSQVNLVTGIDFEELDFDINAEFKESQCSITSLENATNLDFSKIIPFDTFNGPNPQESLIINSEFELEELIKLNSYAKN